MPTQITSKQVEEYYDAVIYTVKMLRYWPQDSDELQEFLDYGRAANPVPSEFGDFREAIASVYYAGRKVGLNELLSERQLFALARNLCRSEPRQKSYLGTLRSANGRVVSGQTSEEIIPFRELEERYQWYLWRKRQEVITGKEPNVKFHDWLENIGCVTFYDLISPCCEIDDAKLVAATD